MSRPSAITSEVLVRGLFEEHGAALMAYAARLTGDHEQAADAVRDALVSAVRRPGELGGERGAVRAYLLSLLRGADGMVALGAVESLPREEREVLHALYFQGRGLAETAASLEVPAETVQTRVHQALRRLREAGVGLGADDAGEGENGVGVGDASEGEAGVGAGDMGGREAGVGAGRGAGDVGGGVAGGVGVGRDAGDTGADVLGGPASGHRPELLGAYVLGVLDGAEWAAVREHLETCAPCRREAGELREAEAALGGIPPEAFVEGPPPGGDPVLRRTLDAVRDEHRHRTRRRGALQAAAAVTGIAAALGAGVVAGRLTSADASSGRPSAVAGARTATTTDARTGVTMTVAVEPAAGWVRVRATIGGVAAGEQCRLYVVARDGSRWQAGSWLAAAPDGSTADGTVPDGATPAGTVPDGTAPDSPAPSGTMPDGGAPSGTTPDGIALDGVTTDGTTLDGSALIAPADVAAVQAETFAGLVLVSTPV